MTYFFFFSQIYRIFLEFYKFHVGKELYFYVRNLVNILFDDISVCTLFLQTKFKMNTVI